MRSHLKVKGDFFTYIIVHFLYPYNMHLYNMQTSILSFRSHRNFTILFMYLHFVTAINALLCHLLPPLSVQAFRQNNNVILVTPPSLNQVIRH